MPPTHNSQLATRNSPTPRIVIVGGGLAGMAAAVALEAAGARATLLESRKSLGGRAGSFDEPQTGEPLDNCQHVLLGCCTNLLDFYRRLGVDDRIAWHRSIRFLDDHGLPHDLAAVQGWPAPLHLAPAFARFGLLTLPERAAVAVAMTAMLRMGRAGRLALLDVPFGDWLDEHAQPASLVRKFYDPVLVSALNEDSRRAAASAAIHVFQEAMLAHRAGYVMGVPACTLAELYQRLPIADLRTGQRAASIDVSNDRATGVRLVSGEVIPADAVVLATNHHAARRLLPPEWVQRDRRFDHLDKLESVPILGAHLYFDRPVMTDPHAALVTGPLQWLFRKDDEGRIIHGVISAARAVLDRPKEELLRLFEAQLRTLLPGAAGARLERGVIIIEKRATFSPLPGSHRFRPQQAPVPGGLPNLYLAGDYTWTGWPATMEGAVRSGYLAAEAAAGARRFVLDDLEPEWPARALGLR